MTPERLTDVGRYFVGVHFDQRCPGVDLHALDALLKAIDPRLRANAPIVDEGEGHVWMPLSPSFPNMQSAQRVLKQIPPCYTPYIGVVLKVSIDHKCPYPDAQCHKSCTQDECPLKCRSRAQTLRVI